MLIQWKAPSHHHRRVISKSDFAGIDGARGGPIEHETVAWEAANDWVADVSDDAAEYLIAHEPGFAPATKRQEEAVAAEEEPVKEKKK